MSNVTIDSDEEKQCDIWHQYNSIAYKALTQRGNGVEIINAHLNAHWKQSLKDLVLLNINIATPGDRIMVYALALRAWILT